MVPQIVEKFPVFCGTRWFITVFTKVRYFILGQINSGHALPFSCFNVNFNFFLPSSKWTLSSRFLHQNRECTSLIPIRATRHPQARGPGPPLVSCLWLSVQYICSNPPSAATGHTVLWWQGLTDTWLDPRVLHRSTFAKWMHFHPWKQRCAVSLISYMKIAL
jgi:hypothetical protein